ncbi:WS/DGAT/MGAT family O-acyltransferase [Williamsia phyllosphaerae]|uniref:Diacylglycerol O-acyltransferase n=1 Tax=Williamsia phyllosphaerae TaxID=885042 RepID=A0ABQ1UBG9_9NOCA|nr:wax ester/triacylglycerol synthase family O-acyltransferase [Williamsia phyllosphaerae]GGF13383.1 diacylglycerol O-acyltransferase [Williamsia phyllosphaerae]
MERLSGLDASFLYLESRSMLMQVVGIIEIDPSTMIGGYSFERLRTEMSRRITAMPTFRRKLHDSFLNIDHPVWIEDRSFDIERHVHRVALPSPGSDAELAEFCSHIAGVPLDRSKPLWEIWVIEGRADDNVAIMLRMHHASVDGVSAADLLNQLCSLTPENPELDEQMIGKSAGGSSFAGLVADGLVNFTIRRPISVARLLPQTVAVPFQWFNRSRNDEAMPTPFSAPRVAFNGTITPHRSIAFTQVSLDDVKRIKSHFDVKLNDVVMAVCAGGLRKYLADTDDLPDRGLIAAVPVSTHDEGDDDKLVVQGTNKVTAMMMRLPTDLDDAVERIDAVRESSTRAKSHHKSLDASLLRGWAQLIPPNTLNAAMRVYANYDLAERHPAVVNVIISNVPGPAFPLYFLGSRIKGLFPLGPVMHGMGLNITVFSCDGQLNIGAIACKEQMPDAWPLMRAIEDDIKALLEACDA